MSCDRTDRAWSCQELVDHADNWSLAGNVGLLKHMEQFAEDLFHQADETNSNLENLLQDLDSTEIQLDLVKNQFLGLQNTQFIESRVYEDDETVAEVTVETTEPKLDEASKKDLLKTAVLDGLKVLDKYYERVSIPESDSEGDETDCSNYVLREKDPYINRPLPYVIGTEEWHTKWHAGLAESSDDSDDEEVKTNGRSRVEDEFSDTDSERNLPVADRRSEAQNIDNFGNITNYADNNLNDVIYEEVNGNSVSAKTPITNLTFAEQLAAKLGDVLTTPGDPEVNTRPIQRIQPSVGNSLLQDVPPEIPDEQFGGPSTGMFSGGGGLFDDDGDSYEEKPPPIAVNSNNTQKKVPNLFDEDDDDDFLVAPPPIQVRPSGGEKKRVGGLFDESDEEEEEVLQPAANNFIKQKVAGPLFSPQEPPALETKDTKRKPIGGVNVLEGFLPRRQASSSASSSSTSVTDEITEKIEAKLDAKETKDAKDLKEESVIPPPLVPQDNKQEKRVLSLFDDTDDLFEDDLFLPSPSVSKSKPKPKPAEDNLKTKKKSLFDDDVVDKKDLEDDFLAVPPPLFTSASKPPEITNDKKTKTRNLFDESSEEEDDMFVIPKPQTSTTATKAINKVTKDLFADSPSLFGEREEQEKDKTAPVEHKSIDLSKSFDTNDLFLPSAESVEKPVAPVAKPRISLFDDKPPLLSDHDWDDPVPTKNQKEPAKSESPDKQTDALVDNKKEIVDENIKSPAKSLPGKLKHNLNINVNALMPGARLPKAQPQAEVESTKIVDEELEVPTENDVKPLKSVEDKSEQEKEAFSVEKPSGPNDETEENPNVSVLPNVTKTRARIMLKRRPSTRQGRKAALASSQSQIPPSQAEDLQDEAAKSVIVEATEKKAVETNKKDVVIPPLLSQSQLLPTSDEHDIFDDIKTETTGLLFDDAIRSEDLFSTNKVIEPSSAISVMSTGSTPRKQLIVEDAEDDDALKPPPLFIGVESVDFLEDKLDITAKSNKKISLFDDIDDFHDSDDLFASVSHTRAHAPAPEDLFAHTTARNSVGNVRVFDTNAPQPSLPSLPTESIENNALDKKEIIEASKVEKKFSGGLFGDVADDDDDLFADPTPKSMPNVKVKAKKANKSLFGDDDDEDDLFGSSSTTVTTAVTGTGNGNKDKRRTESKSLFGDDDDDDIFSNKRSNNAKSKSAKTTSVSGTRKLTPSSSAMTPTAAKNDPLADLFGDSD